ncbi:hypothetical protein L1049_017103 [Liquidambar formosana]|uniref:Patatin n=1 Tax=Liquidambar formosana TaxID=63359 RepID=A0AAP0S2P7_LIQFO
MSQHQTKDKQVSIMDENDQSKPTAHHRKLITVLSIDGGGVRGIIPAAILEFLEEQLQEYDKDARIADYFDVIAGTSTGSIIAAMLTAPDNKKQPSHHETKKPFTASDIVDFYTKESEKIFPQDLHRNNQKRLSLKQRIVCVWVGGCAVCIYERGSVESDAQTRWYWTILEKGKKLLSRLQEFLLEIKYDGAHLRKLVREKLENISLKETVTPVVIPAYSLDKFSPHIFSTDMAKSEDISLSDVVLSSTAAPVYFEPHSFELSKGQKSHFSDGGLAANNPALLALGEAMKLYGSQPDYNNYLVLSIGTGRPKLPEAPSQPSGALIYWLTPLPGEKIPRLIDLLFNSMSDMVDIYMARIFRGRDNYLRIQEYALENSLTSIDDSSAAVLDELKKVGKKLLDDHVSIIEPETGEIKKQTDQTNRAALIK